MAAPVIDGVAAPASAAPGVPFEVVVQAHDPDARPLVLTGVVSDAAGNRADVQVTVPVNDPLTYELLDVEDVGASITQTSPGVFRVVVP